MQSKEKRYWIIILLAIVSIIPWLGFYYFYTKGEPREALASQAMLESGNWILPQRYGDMFATKPPFMHWISAFIAKITIGDVNEFIARIPAALSGIGIILLTFKFFVKRYSIHVTTIASMILLTAFEMHRTSMEARVDMPLSFFMILTLLYVYKRVEYGATKLNWLAIVLSASVAVLIKGPVGAVLPLGIYALYMLYKGENIQRIVIEMFKLGPASLVLPLMWYIAAYKVGGELFWETVYNENFGRFTSTESMGHQAPFYANIAYYIMGFIPWSIALLVAMPSYILSFAKSPKQRGLEAYKGFKDQPSVIQFTWFVVVIVTIFYTIPSGKRSVYLLPAYPFLAILLAQWFDKLSQVRHWSLKLTAHILVLLSSFMMLTISLYNLGMGRHKSYLTFSKRILSGETHFTLSSVIPYLEDITSQGAILIIVVLVSTIYLIVQLSRGGRRSLIYGIFGLMFSINLLLDGYILPPIKNNTSLKEFALDCKEISGDSPLYMPSMDGLRFYVINYYLHNKLEPLDRREAANQGYCFVIEPDYEALKQKYEDRFEFELIHSTSNRYNDVRRVVLFVKFKSKSN
ncbi:MAG: ArnT family glycosyltransferase [Bacteroidales bacterium]